ncbi:hypothetical protein [Cryobacterium tepidiphilum]|uniref:Uncharacterized protein n=1 Tax=Cryobacterium tepidiphilum TaxID=2486026 RepID=A0A3M8LAJ4_9MICO|nr:hypothetical protein [Cryobacterium tepidiphilum]RNE62470.1 hypothetical protein EEJ31_07575 [Cryobacterium tepidiphilum]
MSDTAPSGNDETDALAAEPGNIGDYQATGGPDKLPDTVLPRTGTDDPDDDSINITESDGPDLNAGPDVDTGAGGA